MDRKREENPFDGDREMAFEHALAQLGIEGEHFHTQLIYPDHDETVYTPGKGKSGFSEAFEIAVIAASQVIERRKENESLRAQVDTLKRYVELLIDRLRRLEGEKDFEPTVIDLDRGQKESPGTIYTARDGTSRFGERTS